MTWVDYTIVLAFLTVLALAGLGVSRLIRDSDDIFVAGRELTPFILCATITATNLSMFHFVGMGGIAYQNGVSIIWQNWTGDMALVLSGLFIVPAMRRLRIRSVPEFLEMRYGKWLRVLVGAFWGVRLCVFLGILLYIASTAAGVITGWNTRGAYVAWLAAFSLVSILYSAVGGAWAVAIMDSVQFLVMLAGALVVFPVAMHLAGGLPELIHWLRENGRANHVALVPSQGEFNWVFILAILLLSIKWSSVDQAILQRAFGARSPRIGAKGMVLAGVITTPFAFFWILPGLAVARAHPGLSNPDAAIPWLLSHALPPISRGILGFVLCGLIAAQVSCITADINSVATLFTSDVFRKLMPREPTQRELIFVVRISSLVCGAIMLAVAYGLQFTGAGAVRANLAVVGILDMPLFVITIVYGLFWRRTTWQGAVAGFIVGGLVGVLCHFMIAPAYFNGYLRPTLGAVSAGLAGLAAGWHQTLRGYERWALSIAPIVSACTALVVTPVVSLLTRRRGDGGASEVIWSAFRTGQGEGDHSGERDTFHVFPRTLPGRIGIVLVLGGFAVFLVGLFSAVQKFGMTQMATPLAVGGMLVLFVGGMIRVYAE